MNAAKLIAILGRGPAYGGTTTWDSANMGTGVTLATGDRLMSVAGGTGRGARSTTSTLSSKSYAEVMAGAAANLRIGFGNTGYDVEILPGMDANSVGYDADGSFYVGGVVESTFTAYGVGDVIGLAHNGTLKKLWLAHNGTWQNGDPATGAGGLAYGTGPEFVIAGALSGASALINCGQDPFRFALPSGFSAWG